MHIENLLKVLVKLAGPKINYARDTSLEHKRYHGVTQPQKKVIIQVVATGAKQRCKKMLSRRVEKSGW